MRLSAAIHQHSGLRLKYAHHESQTPPCSGVLVYGCLRRCGAARAGARSDPLHAAIPRAAHALRRGGGGDSDGGTRRGRGLHGDVDAGLVPDSRIRAQRRSGRPRAPARARWRVAKSTKNRWKITTGGAPSVTLRYKVYSREMTVRNNWVEAGFAMLNGAPTFITLVERAARPHEVRVELPAAWKRVETRARAGQRIAQHLPRRRLRHPRRQPDHHRQSRDRASSPSTARSTSSCSKATPRSFDADTAAADVQKIVDRRRRT